MPATAAELGRDLVNLSHDISKTQVCYEIDELLYKNYVNNYLAVNEVDETLYTQILCNAIQEYWQQPADRKHHNHRVPEVSISEVEESNP